MILDKLAMAWIRYRQNGRVRKARAENPGLLIKEIKADRDGMSITASQRGITYLANLCVEYLMENNAENYVSMQLMPDVDVSDRPVVVIVKWLDGLDPAEMVQRLKKEIEQLKAGVK